MITIELRVVPYVFSILTRMTIYRIMDMPRIQQVMPLESFMSARDQKSSEIDAFASCAKLTSERQGFTS